MADIETPVSLLPDLAELGIVEVERGICEDTFENRQTLRQNKIKWTAIFNDDGSPTGNIQGISGEMRERNVLKKEALLENSHNPNSDYLTGYDLVLNDEAMEWCPGWVLAQTRKWNKLEDERERTGVNKWPYLSGPPGRCTAIRNDGRRCANWHSGHRKDGNYCRIHINQVLSQPNVLAASKNRLQSAALAAIDKLEDSLNATSEPVALKAATEILDRVGIRAGVEIDQKVEVTVKPAAVLVSDRLKKLRAVAQSTTVADEDIVDAVVIQEQEADHE